MSTSNHYDVLVIGSGQGANPLAKLFSQHGSKTALVERSAVGGSCVNVGCTPTKTMIASGRVAYLARRGADYGVQTGDISVDMEKVRQRKRDIVERWHSGSVKGLESAKVDVFMGEASFVGERKVKIALNAGEEKEVTADTVLLSVGERPSRPNIPGLDNVDKSRVLNSTSVMELDAVPKHLVVVGGGYIGMEFGQLFRRLGAEVTVIQRAPQLLHERTPMSPNVCSTLSRRTASQSILAARWSPLRRPATVTPRSKSKSSRNRARLKFQAHIFSLPRDAFPTRIA